MNNYFTIHHRCMNEMKSFMKGGTHTHTEYNTLDKYATISINVWNINYVENLKFAHSHVALQLKMWLSYYTIHQHRTYPL